MYNYLVSGISVFISLASLFISYYVFRTARTDGSYSDIDATYADLLKIGLEDPDLRDYDRTSMFYQLQPEDRYRKKYHIYANMCWNLVETIYDRQKDKKGRFMLSETWIPVLFEENRLHYTWFKHNLRLFKPEFQAFVSGELNDIEIIQGDDNDLKTVYERFQNDFDANEIKEYKHIEMLMSKKKYKLLIAKHKVFEDIIGYAFIYEMEDLKILWLDYMSIEKRFQNAGYGTLLFNKIAEADNKKSLGVFFEVEIPVENDPEKRKDQQRRITFYERLGARPIHIDYEFPTDNGGFPMLLYFKPFANVQMITKEKIRDSIISAYDFIHTDVYRRDSVLKKCLGGIKDEHYGDKK